MPFPATLIVTNGRVLTMDGASPRAEAVAVAGSEILAVGRREEIDALGGPRTIVVDAEGGTVLPGFSENHMHLFSGAAELDHLQLAGITGFDAVAEAVRRYAAERPKQRYLFAQGADYALLGETEPTTRHHLDRMVGDRGLILVAADHHTVWASTAALEAAGLLHGRAVGPGNEVVMAADGLASGELREMEAFDPVLKAAGGDRYRLGLSTGGEPNPYPSPEEFQADLMVMRQGLEHCASHGITTIQNMDGNLYQLQLLAALEAGRELPCRVKIPFHFKNVMPLEALDKASAMARDYSGGCLTSGLVKLFYDGVIDSYTASMIDPYADRPDHRGESLFSPARFAEVAVEADRRGLQIAVHAIGDGAVRAALDGFEAARRANGARDSRHRIEHVEVVHPADIARFAELGVIASMQPPHPPGLMGFPLEPTLSRIGRARWPLAYAWRTMKDAGAHVVFASDWPVSPIDPLAGIKAAVTRKPWAEGDPDQSFSLMEALAAYTVEGAYAEFMDHRKGRLKPGFLADIVVLSEDIEAQAPEAIDEIRPVATICGGRITFSAR